MHRLLTETAVYFFFLKSARPELFFSVLLRENEVNDSGRITETFNVGRDLCGSFDLTCLWTSQLRSCCSELCSMEFWVSPRMENAQHLWASVPVPDRSHSEGVFVLCLTGISLAVISVCCIFCPFFCIPFWRVTQLLLLHAQPLTCPHLD